jgi:hypothetical protein
VPRPLAAGHADRRGVSEAGVRAGGRSRWDIAALIRHPRRGMAGHASLSRGLSAPRAVWRSLARTGEGDGAPCGATSFVCARVRSCLRTCGAARRATRMAFALRAHLRRSPAPPVRRRLGVGPRFAGGIRASLSASSSRPAHSGQTGGAPTPPGSAAAWPRARAPHSRDGISPALGPGSRDAASPASVLPAVPLARRLMRRPSAAR